MFNKHTKASGIYRINDNIEKLEFIIYFRHINSILKLPQFHLEQVMRGNTSFTDTRENGNINIKTTTIKWQEKILSANERELYKDANNCQTDQQKEYHQWLKKQELDGQQRKRKGKTKKSKKKQNVHEDDEINEDNDTKVSIQATTANNSSQDFEIFTYVAGDNFTPINELHNNTNKYSVLMEQCVPMYVYVALQPETQLVSLKWYPTQRLLHIYPDFNSMEDNPYFIEIDTDYRDFYAYALQNISKQRVNPNYQELDMSKLVQLTAEMPVPSWRMAEDLENLFNMPPKRAKRIVLLFEIRQTREFIYDNIHVRYHVQLPVGVKHEDGLLTAATHSSICNGGAANFGYTWQLTLLCLEEFIPSDLLHIYFEIISIDSWERERIEGYAHYATYMSKGSEHLHLTCLRPFENFLDSMQRYFVGGRRNFDFKRFFSLDEAKKLDFWCRYQSRMQQTGVLEFTIQKITQMNCELMQPSSGNRMNGMTLDDIMMAFREARRRLQELTLS